MTQSFFEILHLIRAGIMNRAINTRLGTSELLWYPEIPPPLNTK